MWFLSSEMEISYKSPKRKTNLKSIMFRIKLKRTTKPSSMSHQTLWSFICIMLGTHPYCKKFQCLWSQITIKEKREKDRLKKYIEETPRTMLIFLKRNARTMLELNT